jgi:hypothetical protein
MQTSKSVQACDIYKNRGYVSPLMTRFWFFTITEFLLVTVSTTCHILSHFNDSLKFNLTLRLFNKMTLDILSTYVVQHNKII